MLRSGDVRDGQSNSLRPSLIIHHCRDSGRIPELPAPVATPRVARVADKRLGVHCVAEEALDIISRHVSETPEQPQNADDTRRREQLPHSAGANPLEPCTLDLPGGPALLGSDINEIRHDRDLARAMSCESVASGASHKRLPIATGMIARLPITTHETGLSMASISPTVTTMPAQAANTRNFR